MMRPDICPEVLMTAKLSLSAEFETIVAGAGPAGIMAALEAAQAGRVLLVDSSSLPRNKSCGGMINEYSQRFLNEISPVPKELELEPAYVNFRYWDWDRKIKKPTKLRFQNVDRAQWDHWMTTLLPGNVELMGSTTLLDFDQDASGVTVELKSGEGHTSQVRCRTLVGADGARSAVRRKLGVENVATYVTLQDFLTLADPIEPYFDCIYMREMDDGFAYSYLVPKGEVAIVGSVYYPKTRQPYLLQDRAIEMLRSKLPQLGESTLREASTALHIRQAKDVVPGTGNVLLVGEAGGFMSPTSGEGISYALNSGRLAGRAIATSKPADRLTEYSKAVEPIVKNIRRKLGWLPFMESRAGKYIAGFVPTPIVSKVTEGL